jgi:UDP-N-acetylmuramoylalanine--D-glutamate ligase
MPRAAGVPLICDIELFAQSRASLPPHKVVGITGTNGKSTTTALTKHLLEVAGIPAIMGGNIGLPILGQEPLPAGGVYVLELSSYQIDLTQRLDCEVAVLLNLTPDHLDRYDGFEGYVASKARLFGMQALGRLALVEMKAEWRWTCCVTRPMASALPSSKASTCPAIRPTGPALPDPTTAPTPRLPLPPCASWGWMRPPSKRG